MSTVYRVCPKCGNRTDEIAIRFCPACGADSDTELALSESPLSIAASKAALPLLVGVTSFALRFGWKLLQSRARISAPYHKANTVARVSSKQPKNERADVDDAHSISQPNRQPRRRIRIRSAWTAGDSDGNWQEGESEQIIDIDG